MDRYLKFVPTVTLALLAVPFLLFLVEMWRSHFQLPSDASLMVFRFIFGDTLYGQAIAYAQAPFLLALVMRFYAPPAASSGLTTPNTIDAWVFVIVCVVAMICAYLARYFISSDDCAANGGCLRTLLAQDIDMVDKADAVFSAFREYSTALIASSLGLLAVVFGIAKTK